VQIAKLFLVSSCNQTKVICIFFCDTPWQWFASRDLTCFTSHSPPSESDDILWYYKRQSLMLCGHMQWHPKTNPWALWNNQLSSKQTKHSRTICSEIIINTASCPFEWMTLLWHTS
jgi:hypothetical protein